MSRYAKLMKNDVVDGKGVCVSLWMQGCPFHCFNCHNPETWDENGGYEATDDLIEEILCAIRENGIDRNFSVLGGEPLAVYNRKFVAKVIDAVRKKYPSIEIYVWSGYTYEDLVSMNDEDINTVLELSDFLIDGRYDDSIRDITLELRGSSNQRVISLTNDFQKTDR